MGYINMCLTVNGGSLVDNANELARDDDFATNAFGVSGQNQSYDGSITFATCRISYIKFRGAGATYDYGGDSITSNGTLQLKISGTWTTIATWTATQGGTWDTVTGYPGDIISTGWSDVTGIKFFGNITGGDVNTGNSYCKELQAWRKLGGYGGVV